MNIISYKAKHLQAVAEHLARHWAESGKGGPHFLPYDLEQDERPKGIGADACEKDLHELGWQRWFLVVMDGLVLGHASLKSDGLMTGLHRCELGMGLEAKIRGRGIGHTLLDRTIRYARDSETLAWVDLHVMAENHNARALYERFGFEEVAVVQDRFRIHGASVDEVAMTLPLTKGTD